MPPDNARTLAAPRRRQVLAGIGITAGVAGSGCVGSATSLLGRDAPERVTVSIRTVPTDDDPRALGIARFLVRQLEAVGIDARVVPMRYQALLRAVLMNQDFDLYVAEHPGGRDPDFLRPLCHSRFAEEAGWQNPTGYADLELDDLLEAQRRQEGVQRRTTLEEIQLSLARDQPFSVIAFPDDIGAYRTRRFGDGASTRLRTSLDYLETARAPSAVTTEPVAGNGSNTSDPDAVGRPSTLSVAITDPRATENLNPLAAEFRDEEPLTGLLYEPLGRPRDGAVRPWLADRWRWDGVVPGSSTAVVSLRDDLTWHDGTPLTATDVAFTYRFLADTSLGDQESPMPAPRFRGRSSLVTGTEVVDESTVRITVDTPATPVAERCLTVPILPRHVWRERSRPATIAGIDTGETITEALVWPNLDPVGSGPLEFDGVTPRDVLTLTRFDDHFLHDSTVDAAPADMGFAFERLRFVVVPSGDAAVSLMAESAVDAVASGVRANTVSQIGRSPGVRLAIDPARSFFHLGFNVRRRPFGNPRFRRAVARLLDKAYLVEEVLDGYGTPAASPLARHPSLAPGLAWNGADPELPFPGADGVLDVERARDAFREAGYRYSDDGALLLN